MTAAVLWLAMQRAGAPPIDIYDEVRFLSLSLERDSTMTTTAGAVPDTPSLVRPTAPAELDRVRPAPREQDRQGL